MQIITTTSSRETVGPGVATTFELYSAVTLLEGLDLQSIGVVVPRMARELGLSAGQMGLAFSAGTFDLLSGAMLGDRLTDRAGHKRVLILATALFDIFSIATAHMWDFNSLLMIRVATDAGLGAAMPNLTALYVETIPARLRNTAVSVTYCGIPFGGAIAAVVDMSGVGDSGWRHIFYVGGFGPLVMMSLLLILQESCRFDSVQRGAIQPPPVSWVLSGERRTAATLLLRVSYFFTLIVLYFPLNWSPSLMAAQGLSRLQAGMVQILFNIGGSVGALGTGMLMDVVCPHWVVLGMYVGIIAALSLLVAAGGMASMSAGALTAEPFVIGAQSVLYALAVAYYSTVVRGTSVGVAVAMGRLDPIAGSLLAGQLLAMDRHATTIIGANIPVTIVAALAVLLLLKRSRVQD